MTPKMKRPITLLVVDTAVLHSNTAVLLNRAMVDHLQGNSVAHLLQASIGLQASLATVDRHLVDLDMVDHHRVNRVTVDRLSKVTVDRHPEDPEDPEVSILVSNSILPEEVDHTRCGVVVFKKPYFV